MSIIIFENMKSNDDSLVGARIRLAFKHADNLTIGGLVGRSPSAMTAIMSSENAPPLKILLKVRELTGYSIEWILYEEGPKTVAELRVSAGKINIDQIKQEAVRDYIMNQWNTFDRSNDSGEITDGMKEARGLLATESRRVQNYGNTTPVSRKSKTAKKPSKGLRTRKKSGSNQD